MAEETPLVPDITQQVSEEIAEPSKEVVPSDPLSSNGPVPESLVAKDPIPAAIEAETSAGPSKQAETLSETPVISEHPPTPMLDNSMAVDEPPPPPQTIVNDDDERPLNVTDALSYLDQVKVQYQQRPDVYNNFLEIMKQFKSQRCECALMSNDACLPTCFLGLIRPASFNGSLNSLTDTGLSLKGLTRSFLLATESKSLRRQTHLKSLPSSLSLPQLVPISRPKEAETPLSG